jgi:hypothetical protein
MKHKQNRRSAMPITEESREAKVTASRVSPGQFPGEYFVHLNTINGVVAAYFPSSSVDESRRTIKVIIISKNGSNYLVNLPACTLSTGSRAWFAEDHVLME